MMNCQNCGQTNSQTGNFCRFCGTKLTRSDYQNGNNYFALPNPAPISFETSPPRPYSWKTDEFQISETRVPKTKTINRVQPLANFQPPQFAGLQPFQQPPQAPVSLNFHCPRCSSQLYPRAMRQISTAGWIVFAILLVAFLPLFWIGLLIKEDIRVCPVCNFRYN